MWVTRDPFVPTPYPLIYPQLSTKLLHYYALILLERAGEMHHDDSLKERRKACGSVQFTQVRLDANEFMT